MKLPSSIDIQGFSINLPIGGVIAVFLLFTRVPEQRKKGRTLEVLPTFYKSFDLVRFVFFAPAAIMCLLALEDGGNEYPWADSKVIGLFAGAGVTAIVFLFWEYYKAKDAMIPFHLIYLRVAYSSYGTMLGLYGQTMIVLYYLPIYFQAVKGASALISGVNFLPNVLSQMVATVLTGFLSLSFSGYENAFANICSRQTGLLHALLSCRRHTQLCRLRAAVNAR